jgi:DNA-damage-inducible protein J
MPRTAYVNTRIEPALKKKAESIFSAIGLSASTAISLFYRQVVYRRGLPFDVCVPNEATIAALEELERGGGEVVRGSTKQLLDEID